MTEFLSFGVVLGLSAGIAPGPLLALVISETLQHGIPAGLKIAVAPIITDLPIILVTFFLFAKLSNFHTPLGIVSLMGGLFILHMGYESFRSKNVDLTAREQKPNSLAKGVLTNILNPHPYLFWFSVGGPIMIKAMNVSVAALVAFLFSFYLLLVGSKVLLVMAVGKSKSFFSGKLYIYTVRFLGLVLCMLAFVLMYDGLNLLGILSS